MSSRPSRKHERMGFRLGLGVLLACGWLQGATLLTSDFSTVDHKTQLPVGFGAYPTWQEPGGHREMVRDEGRLVLKMVDVDRTREVGIMRQFTFKKGRYYRVTVEAKLPAGLKQPEDGVFALQLRCTDGSQLRQVPIHPVAGEYRRFSVALPKPAATPKLAFFLYSSRAACGEILVRSFTMEDSSVPFPVIGGSRFQATSAQLEKTAEWHDSPEFACGKSVSVKSGLGKADRSHDVSFKVQVPKPGRYMLVSISSLDTLGQKLMAKAGSKFDSLMTDISLDGSSPTRRVIYVPWQRHAKTYRSVLAKFDFTGGEQTLTFRLPEGVRLGELQVLPYRPPRVPAEVKGYVPPVIPGEHPRLWVTKDSLPLVRSRLTQGENLTVWKWVQAAARKPGRTSFPGTGEIRYDLGLQDLSVRKAFVYLMTGDEKLGREALAMQKGYLSRVSYGNLLDITREIGSEIYAASLVFDWCHPLLTEEDKTLFHKHLLRLADDMEIGWPPFKQIMVNGHGNEAQVNRDLLSMGIALYGVDNVPYTYCAYRIFEELLPMRAKEYEAARHNQGYSYAGYRFAWEMHGAWLMRRMTGREIYPPAIRKMGRYWLYGRLPDGEMFRSGDGTGFSYSLAALTMYTYAEDPIMKGEFLRQGNAWKSSPVLYLLLNDPALKAESTPEALPLAEDSGDLMPSLTMRTGWQVKKGAGDVAVQLIGGGVNFGGHQHVSAGSFQIYYRGLQAVDLGQYHFFGTPYDSNFAKRSISKNVVLVYDPKETWRPGAVNDGGQRWPHSCPANLAQMSRPSNHTGDVLAADFGPSRQAPVYGVYNLDLAAAYSKKVRSYVRDFVFLNLEDARHPAALLVCDWVESSQAGFKKYWQINTYDRPGLTASGLVAGNRRTGRVGRMHVDMLWPQADNREVTIVGGSKYQDVFGHKFVSPKPDSPMGKGYRTMVSPKKPARKNLFVNVITLSDSGQRKLPVTCVEQGPVFLFGVQKYLVTVPREGRDLDQAFDIPVPRSKDGRRILATHLRPGTWTVLAPDGKTAYRTTVAQRRGTIFLEATPGTWHFKPGEEAGAKDLPVSTLKAIPLHETDSDIQLDEKLVTLDSIRKALEQVGVTAMDNGDSLTLKGAEDQLVLTAEAREAKLNGQTLMVPEVVRKGPQGWLLPHSLVALFSRCRLNQDILTDRITLEPEKLGPVARQVFCFESSLPFTQDYFRSMLDLDGGGTGYWAARRGEANFDIVFFKPQTLSGIGFKWLRGSSRKTFFRLAVSTDGKTFKKVFEGASSGTTNDFEDVTFPRVPVLRIRFMGGGNSFNEWTSIVKMRFLP